ncbi:MULTISPECIES: hypothetical protein [Serratia]|uniref:hypothetical protein n=1 Tax=Serratia TaxID=613 RepID=UPI002A5A5CD5|nr:MULTISPECIES: hypothetical protein [Serratia]MDY0768602.1 hypothetical protein [Serratia nevei]MED6027244.1 hypothetical protein [Serratia marcescens]
MDGQALSRGPVNRAPLSALMLITDALLETAVGGGLDVDPHYYRQTFGLRGDDWLLAQLEHPAAAAALAELAALYGDL